jgi:hypothetical protein
MNADTVTRLIAIDVGSTAVVIALFGVEAELNPFVKFFWGVSPLFYLAAVLVLTQLMLFCLRALAEKGYGRHAYGGVTVVYVGLALNHAFVWSRYLLS